MVSSHIYAVFYHGTGPPGGSILLPSTGPPNGDITRAAGRRKDQYGWWHTRAWVNRAQVGGCASSVAYMRCSAGRGTVRWEIDKGIHGFSWVRYGYQRTHLPAPSMDTFLALSGVLISARDRRLRLLRTRAGVPSTQYTPTPALRGVLQTYRYALCIDVYMLFLIMFSYIHIYIFLWFGLDLGGWHHGASRIRHHCPARVSGINPGDGHHGASGSRHHCPARVSGLDPGGWHHGASGSRHHRPARVSGINPGDGHHGPLFGASTTAWHTESGWRRPWRRPPNVGITRRCWQAWGAVHLKAYTGHDRSRPGWGCASSVAYMRCSAGRGIIRW
jgi:hypothetical protein